MKYCEAFDLALRVRCGCITGALRVCLMGGLTLLSMWHLSYMTWHCRLDDPVCMPAALAVPACRLPASPFHLVFAAVHQGAHMAKLV